MDNRRILGHRSCNIYGHKIPQSFDIDIVNKSANSLSCIRLGYADNEFSDSLVERHGGEKFWSWRDSVRKKFQVTYRRGVPGKEK